MTKQESQDFVVNNGDDNDCSREDLQLGNNDQAYDLIQTILATRNLTHGELKGLPWLLLFLLVAWTEADDAICSVPLQKLAGSTGESEVACLEAADKLVTLGYLTGVRYSDGMMNFALHVDYILSQAAIGKQDRIARTFPILSPHQVNPRWALHAIRMPGMKSLIRLCEEVFERIQILQTDGGELELRRALVRCVALVGDAAEAWTILRDAFARMGEEDLVSLGESPDFTTILLASFPRWREESLAGVRA